MKSYAVMWVCRTNPLNQTPNRVFPVLFFSVAQLLLPYIPWGSVEPTLGIHPKKNGPSYTQYIMNIFIYIYKFFLIIYIHPKDHWTLNTPAIQVQTLPLEGPKSLEQIITR